MFAAGDVANSNLPIIEAGRNVSPPRFSTRDSLYSVTPQISSDQFDIVQDHISESVGIPIYTVLDDMNDKSDVKSKELHNQMHEAYRAQKFDEAIWHCERLMRHFDGKMEGYYKMWIERCGFQQTQDLPKDWNGVFIATGK